MTVRLDAGHRYGLVGANGSGKTTLLNILAEDEALTDGDITMPTATRVGVLRQDRYLSNDQLILDVAMMGDRPAWEALADKDQLLASEKPDANAIAAIEDRVEHHDGYTLEARASEILQGLGISKESHRQPLSILSGGFKLRVSARPNADRQAGAAPPRRAHQPSRHSHDSAGSSSFYKRYAGCVVVISHDHRFLDTVATHVLDVDYGTVTLYHGNYTAFVADKRVTRERKEAEIERQQQTIAEKKAFVERFRYKATKARQAQSRLKQIEKIEIEELPATSRCAPYFKFEQQRKSGRDVLTVDDVSKAYGELRVLTSVSLAVRRGEQVAIIGANGIGKSTLLRILVGALGARCGRDDVGLRDQRRLLRAGPSRAPRREVEHRDRLPLGGLPAADDELRSRTAGSHALQRRGRRRRRRPRCPVARRRGWCSAASSSSNPTCSCSTSRPTTSISESIEALAEALDKFQGTTIFVSHDRWLVGRLATRIIELTDEGMNDFPGTYEEYLTRQGADHLDAEAVVNKAKQERKAAKAEAEEPTDWAEHKRRRSRQQKLESEREKVTTAIELAEARIAEIQEFYCAPGFFESTPKDEIAALESEESELRPRVESLMTDWERIETELAELTDSTDLA